MVGSVRSFDADYGSASPADIILRGGLLLKEKAGQP